MGRTGIEAGARPALVLHADAFDEGIETEPAKLPVMPLAEHVVNDYQTIRFSLKAHPMPFCAIAMQRESLSLPND